MKIVQTSLLIYQELISDHYMILLAFLARVTGMIQNILIAMYNFGNNLSNLVLLVC